MRMSHVTRRATRLTGVYNSIMRSTTSYERALLLRRSKMRRIVKKTALLIGSGALRGKTKVRRAEMKVKKTIRAPRKKIKIRKSMKSSISKITFRSCLEFHQPHPLRVYFCQRGQFFRGRSRRHGHTPGLHGKARLLFNLFR